MAKLFSSESDLMNELGEHTASFSKVFKVNQGKMKQDVYNCQNISTQVEQIQSGFKTFEVLTKVLGIILLSLLIVFIFSREAGLGILFITILVGFLALLIYVMPEEQTKEKKFVENMGRLLKGFKDIAVLLKTKLTKVKRLCEELHEETCGTDRTNLMRLEVSILELFLLIDNLKETVSSDSVKEVYHQVQKTFSMFVTIDLLVSPYMRKQLEEGDQPVGPVHKVW